jgi:hypothetical protein
MAKKQRVKDELYDVANAVLPLDQVGNAVRRGRDRRQFERDAKQSGTPAFKDVKRRAALDAMDAIRADRQK